MRLDATDGWSLIILAVLLFLSAFFSASEMAFSSISKTRLKVLAEDGDPAAKRALGILERFDQTLSVILVGNNVVNIAASAAATLVATRAYGASGVAIATGVMTLLILTFGEVVPKGIAKERPERVVMAVATPLYLCIKLLSPIAWLFVKLQLMVSRLGGKRDAHPSVTEQELINIIETIEEEGVIDEQQSELMQSAMEFDETTAQEILTPRVDLVAISVDDPQEKIRSIVMGERFSRMPVYRDSIDNIIGVLHTRDYLEAALAGENPIELEPLLSKPLFVHKTRRISTLLAQFRRDRVHMAVVIDDYGGTMGIVTMEDVLEELVGDIWDEDEEAEVDFSESEPGVFSASGDYGVYETMEKIGYYERNFESEYPTMGGWALERFGRVPQPGESFEYNGITVTVETMEDQRITQLHIRYIPPAE